MRGGRKEGVDCSYVMSVVFVVFALTFVAFTHNTKEPSSQEIFRNARSLQENLFRSAAHQSDVLP